MKTVVLGFVVISALISIIFLVIIYKMAGGFRKMEDEKFEFTCPDQEDHTLTVDMLPRHTNPLPRELKKKK